MNRTLRLFAALGMLAIPAAAQAQAITGSIGAQADIATVFSWGTVAALNFGSVVPGTAANATGSIALSRNVGVIYSLPDGANTGKLTGPAGPLQPSFSCGVGTTATAITTAFSACNVTTSVLTLPAPAAVTTEYVVFQGSLSAAQTNIAPGTYSGTIRVTATPN